MANKIFKIGLFFTAIQFLLSSSCNKNGTSPCVNGGYSIAINSEWSPQNQVYSIGDSICLNSNFSKTIADLINPTSQIDYSNSVGIGGNLTIYSLDTVNHVPLGGISKFNFVVGSGNISPGTIVPEEVINILYAELPNSYSFSLNVIARQKGIFVFFVSDLSSNGLRGKNCTNAGFINTLSNTERGVGLFEYAMARPPASQFEIERMYCFRVE